MYMSKFMYDITNAIKYEKYAFTSIKFFLWIYVIYGVKFNVE